MKLAYGIGHYRYVFTYLPPELATQDIVQLPMMSADQGSVLQDSVPQDSVPKIRVRVRVRVRVTVSCGSFRTSALGKCRLQTR